MGSTFFIVVPWYVRQISWIEIQPFTEILFQSIFGFLLLVTLFLFSFWFLVFRKPFWFCWFSLSFPAISRLKFGLGFTVFVKLLCFGSLFIFLKHIQVLGSCLVMVSQAASQTRFRALKHENGIDGSATIIIRVIACFQPLQDCQAEYFRHLLKPVT